LFSPISLHQPFTPEYLFFIEQKSTNDHIARLFDILVDRLKKEHVLLNRYYFHSTPKFLQSDNANRDAVQFDYISSLTKNGNLFIICTDDIFFDPFANVLEHWVLDLRGWRSRTLLNTKPMEEWNEAVFRLVDEGFSVAWAGSKGFSEASIAAASSDLAPGILGEQKSVETVASTDPRRPKQQVYAPQLPDIVTKLVEIRDASRSLQTTSSEQLFANLSALVALLQYNDIDIPTTRSILNQVRELSNRPENEVVHAPLLFHTLDSRLAEESRLAELLRQST